MRLPRKNSRTVIGVCFGFLFCVSSLNAAEIHLETGSDWLTTDAVVEDPACPAVPGYSPDWTQLAYDDSAWVNSVVIGSSSSLEPHLAGVPTIWYPDSNNDPRWTTFYRRTFDISGGVLSASMYIGVDDNFFLYVNGELVLDDDGPGSDEHGPIDLMPYLGFGQNIVAVKAWDGSGCNAYSRSYRSVSAVIDIETEDVTVPAVSDWGLAIMALMLLTALKLYYGRRQVA